MRVPSVLTIGFFVLFGSLMADEPTWLEIDNVMYGAKPGQRGPIGGGEGYANIVTSGDYTAQDIDSLLDALSKAKAGQVVFIPGATEIDLTARIYIDKLILDVPAGVTLAGDRGHSIAGTGRPGCTYVARYNIELGVSLSHCFDMHGGRDRKDDTDIAGTSIEIYNNTFRAPQTPVVIRGVPQEKCDVHHNWFVKHVQPKKAVRASAGTNVYDNAYGPGPKTAM